jgi:hypothetical protein
MDPRRLDQLNKGYQYAYQDDTDASRFHPIHKNSFVTEKTTTSPIKIPQSQKENPKNFQQRYYTEQSDAVNPIKSPRIANPLVEASESYNKKRGHPLSKSPHSPSVYSYVNPNQEVSPSTLSSYTNY